MKQIKIPKALSFLPPVNLFLYSTIFKNKIYETLHNVQFVVNYFFSIPFGEKSLNDLIATLSFKMRRTFQNTHS